MRIEVTRADITLGERRVVTACPIARAVRRIYPDRCVYVTQTYLHVDSARFRLPTRAAWFVRGYDAGWPRWVPLLRPFAFEL